ncbi:MAG TPA: Hsp20/alpha crystallin family protein [Caulobacteraceae bacterium]|nr:Hsp20/alpha crystallin family protein [Caulobacteraceae bacterium]
MAEPQTTPQAEEARAKTDAGVGATAEPRSFDESKAGAPAAAKGTQPADAVAQVVEGGREIAEQGRRAGRQMADAWRQAVDPFLAMQYDMSQWFDDLFRQTFGFRTAPMAHPLRPLHHLSPVSLFGLPPADLKETENAHLLAIELPGLTREDVDLSIVGDTLVVCGHKAEENEDASATYRVSERRYGRFERAFPLPTDVDRAKIQAQFKDGLLKITLPKNPSAAPPRSRIEIR